MNSIDCYVLRLTNSEREREANGKKSREESVMRGDLRKWARCQSDFCY